MKALQYSVLIHQGDNGGFWLEVPALDCSTQGDTLDELRANAQDVIRATIEVLRQRGEEVPQGDDILFDKIVVLAD